jgi:hypothetical protein
VRTTVTTVAGVFNLSRAGSAQIRPRALMHRTLGTSTGLDVAHLDLGATAFFGDGPL